jgi:hypothetical protein
MVTALSRYWQRSLLTPIDRRHGPPYHRRGREPVAGNTGAATWEARSNGAARGLDAVGGGVGTRDRERAARRGFAARIGFSSTRDWGRRTDRGRARVTVGSVPNVVRDIAADQGSRGEMNMIQSVEEPGERIAGFPLSSSAGGANAGANTSRA